MTVSQLVKLWNDFWFAPQPPTTMALFRIAYGLLALQFIWMLFPNREIFFGARAIVSPESSLMFYGTPQLNLFLLLPAGQGALTAFFAAFAIAALMLTVGLCTRLSAAAIFLGLVSLDFRDPFVFNSGDNLLRLCAFYLMLSHAGDALSVDAAIARRLGRGQSLARSAPWAQRLLQLQVVLVYCDAFWTKIAAEQWIDGSAVYYAMSITEFGRLPVPDLLRGALASKVLSWATLTLELAGWTLIWVKDARYAVVAALVAFHLCLDWTLNIPQFQWIMIASLLAWIEPADARAALDRLTVPLRRRVAPARTAE